MREFLREYDYDPSGDLRGVAGELYEEVGAIAMTLIQAKVKRLKDKL